MSTFKQKDGRLIGFYGSPPAAVGLLVLLLVVSGTIQLLVGLSWQLVLIQFAIVVAVWLLSAMIMGISFLW